MPLIILFGDDYQLPPIKKNRSFAGFCFQRTNTFTLNIQANLKDISKKLITFFLMSAKMTTRKTTVSIQHVDSKYYLLYLQKIIFR
jgi:hypothetical protein